MDQLSQLHDMLPAIVKTFCIAHDQDSDETLAQALVYNAARMAWRLRETGITTTEKTSVSDIVTEADTIAEAFITQALAILRPEDGIVGEEGSAKASQSGTVWCIDPVDGTYNFAAQSDYFCTAVAVTYHDELKFAAVHRPAMGYTWFGGPDLPTTRDGQPVHPLTDAPLSKISLGTYLHPTYLSDPQVVAVWSKVAAASATIRMFGAASIDLASVADGSLGAWMQHSVADWDWLPGKALVEGAGGATAQVSAGGLVWSIAGNRAAVAEIVSALEHC